MRHNFYSHGKLLLSGEYAVLDGALSLALPTQFGQSLDISEIKEKKLLWTAQNHQNQIWFDLELNLPLESINNGCVTSHFLIKVLEGAQEINPHFLSSHNGYQVKTKLDFNLEWGLGSSSTLINNIASWANIDPLQLFKRVSNGSGYDIACAGSHQPILYQIKNKIPTITPVDYNPIFTDQLYFIYLNKKQCSKQAIETYRAKSIPPSFVEDISNITKEIIQCNQLKEFQFLISAHEKYVAQILEIPTIKEKFFKDYTGSIKSLGAWGGDFILATGEQAPSYFKNKGYHTIIPYQNMALDQS